MKTIPQEQARLSKLIKEVHDSHQPVKITGARGEFILLEASQWSALQETLYLSQYPGVKSAIIQGLQEPIEKGSTEIEW